jgi:5-oxoprolinase (ATP-hydrolysing) subunit A
VLYRLGAFATFCRAMGLELHHVKLHGALYLMALDDPMLARAVAEAV